MQYYDFTKTSFVRGVQCPKLIFLDRNKKNLATPPDEATLELFKKGRQFEKQVKDSFADGVDMGSYGIKFWTKQYAEATKRVLDKEFQCTIFEAGLFYQAEGILILTDVLRKNLDGTYDVFEIKLSSGINSAIEWDLSLQYYVCKRVLGDIKSFNVVLREDDANGNWVPKIVNKLDFVKSKEKEVDEYLKKFKPLLNGPEPQIPMGEQCEKPYKCNFIDYCKNHCQK